MADRPLANGGSLSAGAYAEGAQSVPPNSDWSAALAADVLWVFVEDARAAGTDGLVAGRADQQRLEGLAAGVFVGKRGCPAYRWRSPHC